MEFYIGKNNWVDFRNEASLETLVKTIQSMRKQEKEETAVTYPGPVILDHDQLYSLGYTTEKIVTETIEIDYITLGEAPNEFNLNEEIEGNLDDWFYYVRSYPETSAMLVVQDKIVGYYQMEFLNDENYRRVMSGESMASSDMEEFYGFGGSFNCYIVIMPILPKYENNGNYILLFNHLFERIVSLYKNDITIERFGISVYTPLLEKIIGTLGFSYAGRNIASGKIYELTRESVNRNPVFKRRYPDFYHCFGGEDDQARQGN